MNIDLLIQAGGSRCRARTVLDWGLDLLDWGLDLLDWGLDLLDWGLDLLDRGLGFLDWGCSRLVVLACGLFVLGLQNKQLLHCSVHLILGTHGQGYFSSHSPPVVKHAHTGQKKSRKKSRRKRRRRRRPQELEQRRRQEQKVPSQSEELLHCEVNLVLVPSTNQLIVAGAFSAFSFLTSSPCSVTWVNGQESVDVVGGAGAELTYLQRQQLLNGLVHFVFRSLGNLQLTDSFTLCYDAGEQVTG
ncbi:hypothetical protein EYF80_031020 [Liparis tanakae]|uniref:Uncharacterized protein n=1 Tax=Liparis tanakae TaxID=230148 RepID=A0A4Z2H090_9TELE|nr:hypothetical protein EYF80_031020 [Liparis tanakae]